MDLRGLNQWAGSRSGSIDRSNISQDNALSPASNPSVASTGSAATAGTWEASSSINGSAFASGSGGPSLPPVVLPSGGGTIRGMGEDVKVNALQGTATATIPILASKARRDMTPDLSLEYNSGVGSGPWGMGWSLSGISDIGRSTRLGLPIYDDERDTFILSGAEDLVPVFAKDAHGKFIPNGSGNEYAFDERLPDQTGGFSVRRYRPRIEQAYNRIERWTNIVDSQDVHWRAFTPSNTMMIFGRDGSSRIMSGPTNDSDGNRIFKWLCCEAYDCYGNAMIYEYKAEDAANVDQSRAHELNRNSTDRTGQRYLKRIKYGNSLPLRGSITNEKSVVSMNNGDQNWMFELVFDYGEHDLNDPHPQESTGMSWQCRQDPISSFQAGFEVRTYRLCRRILMFHHFSAELGKDDYLTKALEFSYDENPAITHLQSVRQAGYVIPDPTPSASRNTSGPYLVNRLPPLELEYSRPLNTDQLENLHVHDFAPDSQGVTNVPTGLQGSAHFVDLYGEGLSGILSNTDGAWYYKRNLSSASTATLPCTQLSGVSDVTGVPKFGPLETLYTAPTLSYDSTPHLMDLNGDGHLSHVDQNGPLAGFYRYTTDLINSGIDRSGPLEAFRPFQAWPTQSTSDPNLRFIDLTGDGKADLLLTQDDVFTWYESLGEFGFAPARQTLLAGGEDESPRILFSDVQETIQLADFCGDGMPDIVRIRNSEICYWPNMGYGRFGAKVVMDNAPTFDLDTNFSFTRLIMADIDGSGTTDLLYFHDTGASLYYNLAGNSWADAVSMKSLLPFYDSLTLFSAVDLLGTGGVSLIMSSSHPDDLGQRTMHYVDLMPGPKPHLLTKLTNNLGKETSLFYQPSTMYYAEDMLLGTPWATRLPFPQQCLDSVVTYDKVSQMTLSQRYRYHHGYYDGIEREFHGFGMVEQWDSEQLEGSTIKPVAFSPPAHTKTWFHIGGFGDDELLARAYTKEYYGSPDQGPATRSGTDIDDFLARQLQDEVEALNSLTDEELREASRALKGSVLRSELYGDDGSQWAGIPYNIQETGTTVRMIQPQAQNQYAVFQLYEREQLSHVHERNAMDSRTTHAIKLEVDEYGKDVQSVSIWYGRHQHSHNPEITAADSQKQAKTAITYIYSAYTNAVEAEEDYRLPQSSRTSMFELPASLPFDHSLARYTPALLANVAGFTEIPYGQSPQKGQKRLLRRTETVYRKGDLTGDHLLGELDALALPGSHHAVCLDTAMVAILSHKMHPNPIEISHLLQEGGYDSPKEDGVWCMPSPRTYFSEDGNDELALAKASFFSPRRIVDEFGAVTKVRWDEYSLVCTEVESGFKDLKLPNITKGLVDYRTLQMCQLQDTNDNVQEVRFDALGLVVGLAVMGKANEAVGDTFDGFEVNLSDEELSAYVSDPCSTATGLLGGATKRFIYDIGSYMLNGKDSPVSCSTLSRTIHIHHETSQGDSLTEISIAYLDGHSRVIQKKDLAEPQTSLPKQPRWRGSAWTVDNNKGLPVEVFEPFFDSTHKYQFDRRVGVHSLHVYDALSREVVVILPNNTWTKVLHKSWETTVWDANDTVLMSPLKDGDVAHLTRGLPPSTFVVSWHDQRISKQLGPQEQEAAQKAEKHAETPTTSHLDAMGRSFLTFRDNGKGELLAARVEFDIDGSTLETRDGLDKIVTSTMYSMNSQALVTRSVDCGTRRTLSSTRGEAYLSVDARGYRLRSQYDELRRRTALFLHQSGGEIMIHTAVYGEGQPDDKAHNLRGKLYQERDQAGVITRPEWDFKGNELVENRQFSSDYKSDLDWAKLEEVSLDTDVYNTQTWYDAKNRVVAVKTPDQTLTNTPYNIGGLFQSQSVLMTGDTQQRIILASCEYDEYGRSVVSVAGNGATTADTFEKLTNRLANRSVLRQQSGKRSLVQNLTYTYDPVGNITYIRNDADPTVFFRNQAVNGDNDYSYDAVYRLTDATGRENIGQTLSSPSGPGVSSPSPFISPSTSPADGSAMVKYTEHYVYDAADRINSINHQYSDTKSPAWTRQFTYEAEKAASNRLVATTVRNATESYTYDENGNMTRMPHLKVIAWDCKNQLRRSTMQTASNGTPETTWYSYNDRGQRVRKVTERQVSSNGASSSTKLKERLYVGNFDTFMQYAGDGITQSKHCDSLRVCPGHKPGALIESWTNEQPVSPSTPLIRFQYQDQVDSVSLELDDMGDLISSEESSPFGSTVYHSLNGDAPKRYRFSGKERDDESGLYYSGLRYYAPWLARWTCPDPIGIRDGLDMFAYCHDNPIRFTDPTGTVRKNQVAPETFTTASSAATSGVAASSSSSSSSVEMDQIGPSSAATSVPQQNVARMTITVTSPTGVTALSSVSQDHSRQAQAERLGEIGSELARTARMNLDKARKADSACCCVGSAEDTETFLTQAFSAGTQAIDHFVAATLSSELATAQPGHGNTQPREQLSRNRIEALTSGNRERYAISSLPSTDRWLQLEGFYIHAQNSYRDATQSAGRAEAAEPGTAASQWAHEAGTSLDRLGQTYHMLQENAMARGDTLLTIQELGCMSGPTDMYMW